MNILTDEEIAGIGQELAAANNLSDIDFARAIEAAIMSKLAEQEEASIAELRQQLAESEAERMEQARLLGMSGEREAGLLAQLAALQLRVQKLREAYVLLENFAQSVGGSSSFWEDMNDKLEPASVIANLGKADASALEALIQELKRASHVTEGQPCKLSKSTVLDAIRAVRTLEEIAIMPEEATRMREMARRIKRY